MIKYAFTAKWNSKKYPLLEDYAGWLEDCTNLHKFNIIDYYYELDSKGKLHVHGIASARKGYYAPNLLKGYKGMATKVKPLDSPSDERRWLKYIKKDQFLNGLKKLNEYLATHWVEEGLVVDHPLMEPEPSLTLSFN